ncbi:MAG: hypothetical protein CMH64_02160 [Nanoarchaeota archaeon]|nr:hypothetical protein [Nanoarchaeota archaeon]|tara:strand:+ start:493 stop:1263 length:771 start_codon:yes stop_codon:yes gene_type:complete
MKDLKKSFELIWKGKVKVLASVLSDFLFFLVALFISFLFFNKFMNKYNSLNESLNGAVIGDQISNGLFSQFEYISNTLNEILFLVLLFYVILFLIWNVFQSLSWLISKNILRRKNIFEGFSLDYFLDFSYFSLIWFLIVGVIFYGYYNYFSYLQTTNPLIVNLPILALIYFGAISFSLFGNGMKGLNSFKKCFLVGVSNLRMLLPFVFFVLILFIIGYILEFLGATLLMGVVILLLFVWFRVYMMLLLKKDAGDRI